MPASQAMGDLRTKGESQAQLRPLTHRGEPLQTTWGLAKEVFELMIDVVRWRCEERPYYRDMQVLGLSLRPLYQTIRAESSTY
jgi:hypothetical protein